jgi:hypothetical protein
MKGEFKMKRSILFILPCIVLLVLNLPSFAREHSQDLAVAYEEPIGLDAPTDQAVFDEESLVPPPLMPLFSQPENNQPEDAPLATGIDLQITKFQFSKFIEDPYGVFCPNEIIDVTITIQNYGVVASGPFWVDFYKDRPDSSKIPCDTTGQHYTWFSGLAAGANTTWTFQTSWPGGKSYIYFAFVDSLCQVSESNEDNNQTGWSVDVYAKPNLEIMLPYDNPEAITFSPANPQVGQPVQVVVNYRNNGCAPAGFFYVDIYKNSPDYPYLECNQYGDTYCYSDGLAAGATATCTKTITYSAPGDYTLAAFVDSACVVDEVTEFNWGYNYNTNGVPITISPAQPDLIVQSITTDPVSPQAGQPVSVTVTIKNQGYAATGTTVFWYDFYKNRDTAPTVGVYGNEYQSTSGLAAGATTSRTWTVTYADAGIYKMWAQVDSEGGITESNEDNNVLGPVNFTIIPAKPDLIITSLTKDVANPVVGQTINVTASIKNQGLAALSSTYKYWLDVYKDKPAAAACYLVGDYFREISALAAQASTTITLPVTYNAAGVYTLRAFADSMCAAVESDENNNQATLTITVNLSPPNEDNCDFDGDGNTDILWRNYVSGQNLIWQMNGTTPTGTTWWLPTVPTAWTIQSTADFDNDSNPDILWRNTGSGQNIIWQMNGAEPSGTVWWLPTVPTAWQIQGAADFDDDGNPDILWRDTTSGLNIIWQMNGAEPSGTVWWLPTVDNAWTIQSTADFDNDSNPDILWRNTGSGQNIIWQMNGAEPSGTVWWLPTVPTAWQIQGAADFDDDGNPDILWRDTTSGLNIIWQMNGAEPSGTVWWLPTVDNAWMIVNE